jgi:glycine cleavage system aminomethyltransferase T
VLRGGVGVGKVAAGSHSRPLRTGVATARVPQELAEPGARFETGIRTRITVARAVITVFAAGTSQYA